MNLIECYVTEILSNPYEKHNKWWIDVRFDCYGKSGKLPLMFDTKEQSEEIKIGHKFLS